MRILVLGSNRLKNLDLATSLLEESALTWEVISSFTESHTRWKKQKSVSNVFSTKELKEEATELKQAGLVLELFSTACLDKPWLKTKLSKSAHLVVVLSNAQVLEPEVRTTFDRVFMTKTPTLERVIQYHFLYVGDGKLDLKQFKLLNKNLTPGQHLQLLPGDQPTVQTVQKASDLVPSPTDYAPPQLAVPKVAAAAPPASNSKSKDRAPLAENCIELNIKGKLCADKTLNDGKTALQDLLGNALLQAMIHTVFYNEFVKGEMTVYFQIKSQRQDLFVALMFNVLQSLKMTHVFETASIHVA